MRSKITIIMSAYNGKKYLAGSIESILTQTFKDFEFIIINDGSTDGSEKILNTYTDPRLRIYHQENLGLTKSLNKALSIAHGNHIARMDVGDISYKKRLETQVTFLDKNPHIAVLGTAFQRIDECGNILGQDEILTDSNQIKNALFKKNQFCHGSTMIRRECLEAVGGYREEFKYCQDYDLWLRMAEKYDLANLDIPLYQWRIDRNSTTVQMSEKQSAYFALAQRLAKKRRLYGSDSIEKELQKTIKKLRKLENSKYNNNSRKQDFQYRFQCGKAFLLQARLKDARHEFYSAIRKYPFYSKGWLYLFSTFLGGPILNRLREFRRALIKGRVFL